MTWQKLHGMQGPEGRPAKRQPSPEGAGEHHEDDQLAHVIRRSVVQGDHSWQVFDKNKQVTKGKLVLPFPSDTD
jgi:S-formylglutathione hydrolase FrmB